MQRPSCDMSRPNSHTPPIPDFMTKRRAVAHILSSELHLDLVCRVHSLDLHDALAAHSTDLVDESTL